LLLDIQLLHKKNLTVVYIRSDGKQMGIQYSKFVPILVKALQELSAKNDALEARIATLEG
jgi:cell division protein FtsB